MDELAVKKAIARYNSAVQFIENLKACSNVEQAYIEYSSFLTAWGNIYTALEQGAKVSPQSRQWFGEVKKNRKSNRVVNYFFQARNHDQHELTPPIVYSSGGTVIIPVEPGQTYTFPNNARHIVHEDGTVIKPSNETYCQIVPAVIVVRGGKRLAPPFPNQSDGTDNMSIFRLTELALVEVKKIIDEAIGMVDK